MANLEIVRIHAREVLDSRGKPTVEAEVTLGNGVVGRAIVPSGASTGGAEACELRDGDKDRYHGEGVLKAVNNVNTKIAQPSSAGGLLGMSALDQRAVDEALKKLDGTPDKRNLGANAILAVSMAVCRAAATSHDLPLYRYIAQLFGRDSANVLPVPMMNILNGGKHANNSVKIQEFMIIPVGAGNWPDALRWCSEIYHSLKKVLAEKGMLGGIGDEGGFAPSLPFNEDAFWLIEQAIARAKRTPGEDVYLAIDSAANDFALLPQGDRAHYLYSIERGKEPMTAEEVTELYREWINNHPIVLIEDGLAEEDWEGWKYLTKELGSRIQLVGDDIFVTSKERLEKGISLGVANAILIKLNQVGTVTETIDCMRHALDQGYNCVVSHRSGETEDPFIADFVVGTGVGQLKSGAPARTDRVAKYNQLLRIHEEVGENVHYPGATVFKKWPKPNPPSRKP